MRRLLAATLALLCTYQAARAAEILTLTTDNWDTTIPVGKEVDCILGDICLRNDQIVAIIGKASRLRNANMTTKNVGGSLIDLTSRNQPNDQLSAFYPLPPNRVLEGPIRSEASAGAPARLVFRADTVDGQPDIEVTYALADGQTALLITTTYTNSTDKPLTVDAQDHVRADGEFKTGIDADLNLFWARDTYWQQAYGVVLTDDAWTYAQDKRVLRYKPATESSDALTLAPGKSLTIQRWIFPAADTFAVRAQAAQIQNKPMLPLTVSVSDPKGPVQDCTITLQQPDGMVVSVARTNKLTSQVAAGKYQLVVAAQGRVAAKRDLDPSQNHFVQVDLPLPGYIHAQITDANGGPIACKCEFIGKNETPKPDFGPPSAIRGVGNLQYTPDGRFQCELLPGEYDVLISHGNEHDAVTQTIKVVEGQSTDIQAQLKRTVNTSGWISADFHSHSSPSGDNTSNQRGRVLNLLSEHIEFAPCTEHNRIDTYEDHLRAFDAIDRLATCTGMELTGSPLPVNHQNAFPLKMYPRTQDNGAPIIDLDPVVQVERLAMWDNGSDKLVQMNHPNLVQILGDRDLDGKPDGGFAKMFGFVDVIEVHPPQMIFEVPTELPIRDRDRGNPVFHWMQMINLGYRITGVVNTDAHWNFHGSGWLRNYIKSNSDNPAEQNVMDLVHACERGAVMMTNGPFLEVTGSCAAASGSQSAELGDTLTPTDGQVRLAIRVECANWVKVNRVQVFVNGKADPKYNYTTRTHPTWFAANSVVFSQTVEIDLPADAHLIVAATGEGEKLGLIGGPEHSEDPPIAVTNPIYVDIDGNGFTPNQDQLGLTLPLSK